LTDNLKAIFAAFHAAVVRFGHHHRAAMPLVTILLSYFNRAAERFVRAAAKPATPPKPPHDPAPETHVPDCAAPDPAPPEPRRPRAPSPFPTKFAWLLHLMPTTPTTGVLAAQTRHELIAFINDPALIALLEAKPGLGRILRPLCRMFGIETPVHLRLPPRSKPKRKPKIYLWPRPLAPEDIRTPDEDHPFPPFGPGSRFWPPRRKYRENFS
jgi:hypothetical protein